MSILQRILHTIAPPGTSRGEIPRLVREAVRVWRHQGFRTVWYLTRRTIQAHWRGFMAYHVRGIRPYTYADWIKDNEPDAAALARQRQQATGFAYQPRFSVITPVYNPPPEILRETVQSVLDQTYPHWELYLVNGASDRPGIRELLDEFAAADVRIHVLHLAENRGISGNSNAALEAVTGEFVALLDHDDLLAPNTLYAATQRLNERGGAESERVVDIVYFDEDKIAADGTERRQPWFKPDWAPDTLLGGNILMHCVIRRTLLQTIGGFDPAMDGAQDWDVALRASEVTARIEHIPQVLYHWRQIEGSASLDANAKPWAYTAQARCINAHLARLGIPGTKVIFPQLGVVRILWPTANAKVSIIIPTKDKIELLRACLLSILTRTTYEHYEIILVDTGSTQPETWAYYESLRSESRVTIVHYAERFNFSKANNFGARHASGELLLFLNNDTEVQEPTWLEDLAGWAMRPEIGVVGNKLIRPDSTIQHAGLVMGLIGHGSHVFDGSYEHEYGIFGSPESYRNYLAVTGACMMLRREVFDELGGFDEVYEIGFSDIDLCLRAGRAGYRVVYTPFARLVHREGGSRGMYLPPADILRATLQMWPVIRQGDPHFNPNLSYLHRVPTLARPNEETSDQRLLFILQQFHLVPWSIPPRDAADDVLSEGRPLPVPTEWPACQRTTPARTNGRQRLCLITHDLSLSGGPLMLCTLARYLQQHGYQLSVFSPKEGPLRTHFEEAGIAVTVAADLIDDVRVAARVVAQGWDLVLANTILSWKLVHTAKAFNTPSILWVHESMFGRDLARNLGQVADALAVATRVVFPAQATADLYREFLTEGNEVVLPYGLDTGLLAQEAAAADAPSTEKEEKPIKVVCIGSVEPRKGQDVLLQAIQAMRPEACAHVEFYVLGRILDELDARFTRSIRKTVSELPHVHLLGQLPHEAIMGHLAAADIFVLPSRDEVLPVTIIEAMYHGKAIIATRVGGVAELIEQGVSGHLVAAEDAPALARSLETLCADAALRARLGERARATFLERLTLERFGQAFVQQIEEACAAPAHPQQDPDSAQPALQPESSGVR